MRIARIARGSHTEDFPKSGHKWERMLGGARDVCIRDSFTTPPNSKCIMEKVELLLPALKLLAL